MHQDVGSRAQSSEVGCDLAPVVEHFITQYPARKSRVEEALEEEEIIIIIGRVCNFLCVAMYYTILRHYVPNVGLENKDGWEVLEMESYCDYFVKSESDTIRKVFSMERRHTSKTICLHRVSTIT